MKWTAEAEAAIKKAPFFVRKKIRVRVEKEAVERGRPAITPREVTETQRRYLTHMESEIKGYQIDSCFGPAGCPNQLIDSRELIMRLETLFEQADLLGFLKSHVPGQLKFHHEFRVTFAECPNACSQPQIKDIGIIGAKAPMITDEPCTLCLACRQACREHAITLDQARALPAIDPAACLNCGQCIDVCPSQTLMPATSGYRVQLGGKLGRHPQLARELPGIFTADAVVKITRDCIDLYKRRATAGQRFAMIFTQADFEYFSQRGSDSNYGS